MGSRASGAANGNWKGGRVVDPRGYVLVRVGIDHPLADVRGYAYEHRLRAYEEGRLGANDPRIVHHEDEEKSNNDGSNLEPVTRAEHRRLHRKHERGLRNPGEGNPAIACACGCGASFPKFDSSGRPRRFVTGHNNNDRTSASGRFGGR